MMATRRRQGVFEKRSRRRHRGGVPQNCNPHREHLRTVPDRLQREHDERMRQLAPMLADGFRGPGRHAAESPRKIMDAEYSNTRKNCRRPTGNEQTKELRDTRRNRRRSVRRCTSTEQPDRPITQEELREKKRRNHRGTQDTTSAQRIDTPAARPSNQNCCVTFTTQKFRKIGGEDEEESNIGVA